MLISNHRFFIGADASIILGVLSGFCVFTLLVLLYIKNKRWLWSSFGTYNCCENPCPPVSTRTIPLPSVPTSSQDTQTHKHNIVHTYSVDYGDSSSESEESITKAKPEIVHPQQENVTESRAPAGSAHDLISLVEKGRIGLSSNSSCCSSTTSSAGVEKHFLSSSRMVNQFSEEEQRTSHELRETSIGRRNADCCDVETTHVDRQVDTNCNRDCIVMVNIEPEEPNENCLASASQDVDHQGSNCGNLQVTLLYDAPMRKMTVHVLQARIMPGKIQNQFTHTQVRLVLLPSKKQKYKTKTRTGENPQFMESFLFHRINPEDVNSMGIRLRLYACERIKKEKLLGECIVKFANLNLELENNFWLDLERKASTSLSVCGADRMSLSRSDSIGSSHSMQHGGVPELLLGLSYNATTGRLTIEVIKGSHFRDLALNRPPDTYVKLNLVSSTGQELAHSKTTIRRGQPNPLFKETFVFQVTLFQLADVTLMVSIYNRKGVTKKKEMLGWFSLGLNSSGAEEFAHWMDMKEYQQEQICRWHILVQS